MFLFLPVRHYGELTLDGRAYGPLLDSLRGVRWPSKYRTASGAPGAHKSSQRGVSGEFTEYRLYRQGDDPRTLDWKLLARSDRAFVRITDDRTLITTWLVVDASASMNYPLEPQHHLSKWQMACSVAVGLGAVVHASNDPVGMITSGANGLHCYQPRSRGGVIQELISTLANTTCGGSSELVSALQTVSPRSRVVLITDCLGDLQDTLRHASTLIAAGIQFECVHIIAYEELHPPVDAHVVHDPEDKEGIADKQANQKALVLSQETRDEYLRNFSIFCDKTREQWRSIGAGYTRIVTADDPGRAVRAVISGTGSC